MGSLRFNAILFSIYSHDHLPPHVHAYYGEVTMILDLLPGGGVELSSRKKCIDPANAKRNDVRRVLKIAHEHEADIRELWKETHGTGLDG
jgi:hypothetical protein